MKIDDTFFVDINDDPWSIRFYCDPVIWCSSCHYSIKAKDAKNESKCHMCGQRDSFEDRLWITTKRIESFGVDHESCEHDINRFDVDAILGGCLEAGIKALQQSGWEIKSTDSEISELYRPKPSSFADLETDLISIPHIDEQTGDTTT